MTTIPGQLGATLGKGPGGVEFVNFPYVPSPSLTWNLKMMLSKFGIPYSRVPFLENHVKLLEGVCSLADFLEGIIGGSKGSPCDR